MACLWSWVDPLFMHAGVSKEAVRFFREDDPSGARGLLLYNSSEYGHIPVPFLGYYTAAKHGEY